MRDDIDPFEEKRRRLAGFDKPQLVELLASILVSVETLVGADASQNQLSPISKGGGETEMKLTKSWMLILRKLSTYKHFRASDIILVSRELFKDDKISRIQTPGSARAQLCQLTKRGITKRIGGGNYRVTDQTKRALDRSRR